jgi:hypothetical protein
MNLKKVKTNESGIIFVTVLVLIIVMVIMTVSILSMNVSQVMVTESEVKRIQAEMLAQSSVDYFNAYQQVAVPLNTLPTVTQPLAGSGVVYNVGISKDVSSDGINNTHNLTITISY